MACSSGRCRCQQLLLDILSLLLCLPWYRDLPLSRHLLLLLLLLMCVVGGVHHVITCRRLMHLPCL
jgi:hypothetical protein